MIDGAPPPLVHARRRLAVAAAIIASVTLLVYAPGLAAGFVGDDFMILHRLRTVTALTDVVQFFNTEFFEFYRPLGFVAHAVDHAIAGEDPRQYHLTNLLLHTINSILVMLIGHRLSPHSLAGPIAALLFALHPSNHEAVMWISARFDLLATSLSLTSLWLMMRRDTSQILPAAVFALAVLSKESAVALPVAIAGWAVFYLHDSAAATVRRLVPWLAALALCAAMRYIGGGVSAVGGSSRLPKLLAFVTLLALVSLLGHGRWERVRERLRRRRAMTAGVLTLAILSAAGAATSGTAAGRLVADKLAVAGFALFHLVSPVIDVSDTPFYVDPSTMMYWGGGLVSVALAVAVLMVCWQRLLDDDRMWFLATLLLATLLPVSALTEGKRYVYLPSAAFSVCVGVLLGELYGSRRKVAMAAITVVLAVSVVQVSAKIGDWTWAGRMTAEGAQLVDTSLAPSCNAGHVVFLTSPVAIRGVYTHFYYETFELPRGCMPELFQVVVRVSKRDSAPRVEWDGPDRITITVDRYDGNFGLSQDLREFDRPLHAGASVALETPLGSVRADPFGTAGARLTLTLSTSTRGQPPLFFYYSEGRIHRLQERDGRVSFRTSPATAARR